MLEKILIILSVFYAVACSTEDRKKEDEFDQLGPGNQIKWAIGMEYNKEGLDINECHPVRLYVADIDNKSTRTMPKDLLVKLDLKEKSVETRINADKDVDYAGFYQGENCQNILENSQVIIKEGQSEKHVYVKSSKAAELMIYVDYKATFKVGGWRKIIFK